MKALKFIEGSPPAGFKKESESFLFNTAEHRRVQASDNWISFHLINEEKRRILASLHFHLNGKLAESPYKAPFGSIEFSSQLQPEDLYKFLNRAETNLKKKGVNKIIVRQPPQIYQPSLAALTEALFINSGYHVSNAEINMSINVNHVEFEDRIDAGELRKLRRSRKAKLEFRELSIGSLKEVYSFIADCRKERKQTLSMTFEALRETVSRCGESFFLFGVFKEEALVAAAIDIVITEKILYNFYPAHTKKMDALSPVVMLMDGVYSWCKKRQIELLDLGTSASGNLPNFGLLDFKFRLGGQPSIRYTFEKELTG